MTQAELAVVAALGASALTALASLGVVALRERLRRKATDRETLIAAITAMLSRSISLSLRAQMMGEAMKIRSGLGEGIDVLTHQRKPLDPLEFHDWLAQDVVPLSQAWSVVWARGDQEMVRRANALLASCNELMDVSTARMPAATLPARVRRQVVGERWTPEMIEELLAARKAMAHAREQLAQYARTILRLPEAKLFGHDSPDDDATLATQGNAATAAPVAALDGKTPNEDMST